MVLFCPEMILVIACGVFKFTHKKKHAMYHIIQLPHVLTKKKYIM